MIMEITDIYIPGNKYLPASLSKTLRQIQKRLLFIDHEIFATETLERVETGIAPPIQIKLQTMTFNQIEGVFDSGSTLNCIRTALAIKKYPDKIKKGKDFYVRTANGTIILNDYIETHITRKKKHKTTMLYTKWFLLPSSPYEFIISRNLFYNMGFRIVNDDGEFVNKSVLQSMEGDLYEPYYDKLENPMMDESGDEKEPYETKRYATTRTTQDCIHYINEQNMRHDSRTHHKGRLKNIAHTEDLKEQQTCELDKICGDIGNSDIKNKFTKLITTYEDRYAKTAADIGQLPNTEFEIKLKKDAEPFASRPYPHAYKHADEIKKQCDELLKAGFIQPSKSEWASPIIMVPKPAHEGTKEWRMCVDYRELNQRTVKDKYPLPSMADLYRKLRGNKVFSNFDLRSGYYHIPIRKEDQHKTAFITDHGMFEWRRMSFGFTNAPGTFQRAMDRIFHDMQDFVIIYLDDIIVCSKTEEEHFEHLSRIFKRLREHQMKLRLIKCRFFQRQIKYLGIWVSDKGIAGDPEYINKVLQFSRPRNSKEVERYIGMVTWLARFIPNLSKLTYKINELKNKKANEFEWTDEHEVHFQAIQCAVSETKLLRHPDFTKEFYVQTDASDHAVGAVLLQDFGRGYLEPIEFASRKLKKSELNYHVSEKELVAVVFALTKWIRYLLPSKFTVFTDHKNLEELFKHGGKKRNARMQRWIILLQQFYFTAKYLPGKKNYIADYLSRDLLHLHNDMLLIATIAVTEEEKKAKQPETNEKRYNLRRRPRVYVGPEIYEEKTYGIMKPVDRDRINTKIAYPEFEQDDEMEDDNQSEPVSTDQIWTFPSIEELKTLQNKDKELSRIIRLIHSKEIQHGISRQTKTHQGIQKDIDGGAYKLSKDGLLFKKREDSYVLMIPTSLIAQIVGYFHEGNAFQHQGMNRMIDTLKARFYWKNMKDAVIKHVQHCDACQKSKAVIKKNEGKTTPIFVGEPFEQICMDLVGSLPMTHSGFRYILTIMDRFSKFVVAVPLKRITVPVVAQAIMDRWIYMFGPPKEILSDNGTQFRNKVLGRLSKSLNIKQKFTTTYNPQCNGMIERFHSFLKARLRIATSTSALDYWEGDEWNRLIPCITFAYNTTIHSSTKYEPYQVLFGRRPRLPIEIANIAGNVEENKMTCSDYESYLAQLIKQLGIIRNKAFRAQYKAQMKAAERINKTRTPFIFQVGDWVLKNVAITRVGNEKKLKPQWVGPYEIIHKAENGINYTIQDVYDGNKSENIHGKRLKKYRVNENENQNK